MERNVTNAIGTFQTVGSKDQQPLGQVVLCACEFDFSHILCMLESPD